MFAVYLASSILCLTSLFIFNFSEFAQVFILSQYLSACSSTLQQDTIITQAQNFSLISLLYLGSFSIIIRRGIFLIFSIRGHIKIIVLMTCVTQLIQLYVLFQLYENSPVCYDQKTVSQTNSLVLFVIAIVVMCAECWYHYRRYNEQTRDYNKIYSLDYQIVDVDTIQDRTCSICLETTQQNKYQNIRIWYKVSCQHTYHKECIEKWTSTHKTCPLCRQDIFTPVQTPVQTV